jgi:hypothetical protein
VVKSLLFEFYTSLLRWLEELIASLSSDFLQSHIPENLYYIVWDLEFRVCARGCQANSMSFVFLAFIYSFLFVVASVHIAYGTSAILARCLGGE